MGRLLPLFICVPLLARMPFYTDNADRPGLEIHVHAH